jgi:calcineurin-like phosphoesterase family protein
MTDWFTSDTHFGHLNIIKYTNRPFSNTHEMDAALIKNINDNVMPDDRLFHLGDVSMRQANLGSYRSRIACKEVFVIPGNHDREKQLLGYFKVLPQCYMYENKGFRIVLCHYAMRVWPHSHHGAGMLYGHSHGGLPPIPGVPSFDVGVDCWNYMPLSLTDVQQEMKRLCSLAPVSKEHLHHDK